MGQLAQAIVIVESIGQIKLLNFISWSRAPMAGSSLRETSKGRRLWPGAIYQLLDTAIERCGPERVFGSGVGQAQADDRTGFGFENVPGFILFAREATRTRRIIVWMNLNRKPLGREDIFDE